MKDASVEVRCPKYMKTVDIDTFISEKSAWIKAQVAKQLMLIEQQESFVLEKGTPMHFMGKYMPLRFSQVHYIDGSGFYISGKDLKKSAEQLYKRYAEKIIKEKVTHFSKIMGASPLSVKINSANTRWGSCSGKNSLNFSWKLILADEAAIDYVVVHELAHTFEHNHSTAFWAIVEQYIPDYRNRRKLLEKAQKIIASQDW